MRYQHVQYIQLMVFGILKILCAFTCIHRGNRAVSLYPEQVNPNNPSHSQSRTGGRGAFPIEGRKEVLVTWSTVD